MHAFNHSLDGVEFLQNVIDSVLLIFLNDLESLMHLSQSLMILIFFCAQEGSDQVSDLVPILKVNDPIIVQNKS